MADGVLGVLPTVVGGAVMLKFLDVIPDKTRGGKNMKKGTFKKPSFNVGKNWKKAKPLKVEKLKVDTSWKKIKKVGW